MTGNQSIAKHLLGYVPPGYVCVAEHHGTGQHFRVGAIYVDGRWHLHVQDQR